MGSTGCPETSVRNYYYTARNSLEERSSHRNDFTVGRCTLCAFTDTVDSQKSHVNYVSIITGIKRNYSKTEAADLVCSVNS